MFVLTENDYAAYYRPYLEGLPSRDIFQFLEDQKDEMLRFMQTVPEDKWDFAYDKDKWTIREVLGHLVDSEIIFGYRALAFVRGEKQALPGYEENDYVKAGRFTDMDIQLIVNLWLQARELNLDLFHTVSDEDWEHEGTANGNLMKAGAIPYIIAGHVRHHLRIIKERYLNTSAW